MAVRDVGSVVNKYAAFVKNNPLVANELEVALRWLSYLAAGHFTQSVVVSEFVHSASNLLTLLNDTILRKAASIPVHVDAVVERLQTSLSVIEYVEVFAEVAARQIGNKTRWIFIVVIQLVKCVIRLVLVLKYKQGLQLSPTIPTLNRRRDVPQFCHLNNDSSSVSSGDPCSSEPGVIFTLKRSGRVIRTLEAAPPLSGRTWKLPYLPEDSQGSLSPGSLPIPLTRTEVVAEILHITRPLVHLAALGVFGERSWKSWLTAFAMDTTSLHMLKDRRCRQHVEKAEWGRRAVTLLVYLLRSPFYDNFSKVRILSLLQAINDSVPGARIIIRPLIEYFPEWQRTYFYIWSL